MYNIVCNDNSRQKISDRQVLFWERFWSRSSREYPLGKSPSVIVLNELSSISEDAVILEIGTGDGRNLPVLSRGERRIAALDCSSYALSQASERNLSDRNIQFQAGFAANLPFDDNSFDVVVATDLLNHLANPKNFVSEASRVLVDGGIFLGNALSINDPGRKCLALRSEMIAPGHFRFRWDSRGSAANESAPYCTMRYFERSHLRGLFESFDWTAPPAQYSRVDSGHPAPFNSERHEHVFWKLYLRNSHSALC
jgi:SAM-dependent methyltransferase